MEIEDIVELWGRIIVFKVSFTKLLQKLLSDDPIVFWVRFQIHFVTLYYNKILSNKFKFV